MSDNAVLSEKDYQKFIRNYLHGNNGFLIRNAKDFDRLHAMDPELLFRFLDDTQPDTMVELRKIYKGDFESTIINYLNQTVTDPKYSLVETLKNGVQISNKHIDLMYTKPATDFNPEEVRKYQKNIFSVMEEVQASDKERIDLVIFLNGFAIMSFELKCEAAGQSYHDAIRQYRTQRDPKTRLFLWKAGCIVNFAMDLSEVYMTTKLEGNATYFRPFNMGSGTGINAGAGNPIYDDKYSTYYMWEDILTKDTILDLVSKFIFIERKDEEDPETGKKKHKEAVIFPRYHQLDLIRKLLADVKVNKCSQNYLIEHSAGSGKTNSIAWLTYRLTSLHDNDNHIIFDTIIVVTDRRVVDRQLQAALLGMDHQTGQIKVMDDKCTSNDLKDQLEKHVKIIATTIQKFPYIVDNIKAINDMRFAVIIDEAHSSTSGKDMQAVTSALSSDGERVEDAQDYIEEKLRRTGKPDNMSVFAFTATPKPTTLRMFGRLNAQGQYQAFHLYSMKQAIEEGYILDVLQNYTTYKTFYHVNKAVADDPMLKTSEAKKQIARFAELHDTNITQRVEVIVEHFRQNVMDLLGGQAKAMVITSSRAAAVKYRKAFEAYITKRGYDNIHALVAFSGKVKLDGDDTEYTETGMNGFPENQLPDQFDSDAYNILLVANKYQTGFDQPKLCAMYVLKKLRGVNAVQTLSRLNRTLPEKKTFILDFVNDYEDIQKAFAPYYTTTLLANDFKPMQIYDIKAQIEGYSVIDQCDVDKAYDLIFKKRKSSISSSDQKTLVSIFTRTRKRIMELQEKDQKQLTVYLRNFRKLYDYLVQVTCLDDPDLYRWYVFIDYLLHFLNVSGSGTGFDLRGKVKLSNFIQEKTSTHVNEKHVADPVTHLASANNTLELTEAKKEKLSVIIKEINSRTGESVDTDVATKAMLQIRDLLMKSKALKKSAKANSETDFDFSYYDSIDDALIQGLENNEVFYKILLDNEDIKKEVLGIFKDEIYHDLRTGK